MPVVSSDASPAELILLFLLQAPGITPDPLYTVIKKRKSTVVWRIREKSQEPANQLKLFLFWEANIGSSVWGPILTESWVIWTFVHKTSKNQLPAALLPSSPTGTLGKGLVLRPSPHHTLEPARQQHRKCQPLSPEQLTPITQTQLETLSWDEAGAPDARPDRKSYTQTKAALQPRQHTTQWLVRGWGRQPEGRLGTSSQGSSCGSGRLACSLISEPLHYHNQQLPITGHPERAEFIWSSFYWTPPITQQRRNCYPHLHMRDPRLTKTNDLSHHHRDRSARTGSRAQVFCITFLSARHPGLGK